MELAEIFLHRSLWNSVYLKLKSAQLTILTEQFVLLKQLRLQAKDKHISLTNF